MKKLEWSELLKAAEEGRLGAVREHLTECDGFEAAQDLARLVNYLFGTNQRQLWLMLLSIHKWAR